MHGNDISPVGTVTGTPGIILQIEGAAILAVAVAGYATSGFGWWTFALLFLVPDVVMLGYLAGPKWGALVYNVGHTTLLPLAVIAAGWGLGVPVVLLVGLVWLAHVGFDRMVGYGLKYPDAFRHTHLG